MRLAHIIALPCSIAWIGFGLTVPIATQSDTAVGVGASGSSNELARVTNDVFPRAVSNTYRIRNGNTDLLFTSLDGPIIPTVLLNLLSAVVSASINEGIIWGADLPIPGDIFIHMKFGATLFLAATGQGQGHEITNHRVMEVAQGLLEYLMLPGRYQGAHFLILDDVRGIIGKGILE
ncbi:MAG: hypothetical protein M1827_003067 [Pycnora praestabilis]|nr:MAG: hypothetical protein M1827_003067 [Pycnora praestabilis]